MPPAGNANYAWIQHFSSKLSPRGAAGIVLANGSLSSQQSGEGEIRRRLVDDDLVECIVALPGQLFYGTGIPVSLWFLNRDKTPGGARAWRDRRGEILFIDARTLGHLISRVHRNLSDDDIALVANAFHAWRGEADAGRYADVPGFCYTADLEEIRQQQHVLTPGRYVGARDLAEEAEQIDTKIERLTKELLEAFDAADAAQARVRVALEQLDG